MTQMMQLPKLVVTKSREAIIYNSSLFVFRIAQLAFHEVGRQISKRDVNGIR